SDCTAVGTPRWSSAAFWDRKGIGVMRSAQGLFAALLLLLAAAGGRGQIVVSPLVPAFPVVSGLRLSYATRGVAVAGVVGNPYLGPSPFAPATFWSPFAIPATRVTVYYNSPAVLTNPPIVVRQPIVVVPERRVEPGEDAEFFRIEPRRGKPPGRDAKPQADRAEPAP